MVYNAFASPCFKDNPCRQPKLRIDHSNSNFLCQDAPQRLKSRAVPTWIPEHLGCVHVWALDSSPLPLVPCVLLEKKTEPHEHHHILIPFILICPEECSWCTFIPGMLQAGSLEQGEKGWIQTFSLFSWHGLMAFFCTWKGNFWYQAG